MGDLNNNLFDPSMTTGDLSKIKPVVRVVQIVSVWVISIIGLSITISTILKQAVHGLYATNPKFWDKVAEIHEQKLGATVDKGGNQIQILLGFGLSFVFSLLPNVKAITEFDGDAVDPKTFFTKSLPISCLYLFIGVFIFYGYTTKVGEKVSLFGTELLDNFFLQIDPLEWAEKVPTSFAKINLSTSGSKEDFDAEVNSIAKKAYAALKTDMGDISKEYQPRVALAVEQWVISCMEENRSPYMNKDAYSMSYNARTTTEMSDLSRVHQKTNSDQTEYTVAYQKPVSEFNTGSANATAAADYLRIDVTFTKKALKNNVTAVDCEMVGGTYSSGTNTATIDLGDIGTNASLTGSSGLAKIDGNIYTVTISGSKVTFKPREKKVSIPNKVTDISEVSGIYYTCGGKSHPITSWKVNGQTGTGISFSPKDNTQVNGWSWGEQPASKSDGKTSTNSLDNTNGDSDNSETESETKDSKNIFN